MATWTPRQYVEWHRNTAASTPVVSLVNYDLNDAAEFEQLLEDIIAERCITPVVAATEVASHLLQAWRQQFKGQEAPSAASP
jgi:hypothetical protein